MPSVSKPLPVWAVHKMQNQHRFLASCHVHNAGGFSDSSVRIYDLERMAAARAGPQDEAAGSPVSLLWGHSGAVYSLDYTPDQQLLLTSSADGTVRLWSTELAVNLVAYRSVMLIS